MFVVKASLANKALREAAGVWRTYHLMEERTILQSVADTMNLRCAIVESEAGGLEGVRLCGGGGVVEAELF